MGWSWTGAFSGHMARLPASEACSLLSQFVAELRSEFREVLGADRGGLLLSTSMGRLVTGIA